LLRFTRGQEAGQAPSSTAWPYRQRTSSPKYFLESCS
jgi:hypothetical protein